MKTTINYGLKKPEGTDVVNIEDLNYNADVIDKKIKEVDTKASNIKVPVTSVNGKTGAVTLAVSDLGAVPTSRKVNNKPLSADIALSANDIKTSSGSTVESQLAQKATKTEVGNINDTTLPAELRGKSLTEMAKINFTSGVNAKDDIRNAVNSKGGSVPINPTVINLVDSINKLAVIDLIKLRSRILDITRKGDNLFKWYITQNGEFVTIKIVDSKDVYIEKYNLDNVLVNSTKIYTSASSIHYAIFSMYRGHVVLFGSNPDMLGITKDGVLKYSNLGYFSSNRESKSHKCLVDNGRNEFVVEATGDGYVRTYTTGGTVIDATAHTAKYRTADTYGYDNNYLYLRIPGYDHTFYVELYSGRVSYANQYNMIDEYLKPSIYFSTLSRTIY
ncbi:hypothetical protein KQI86_13010 [Clostridium sp. MSJ-11]|uniref:Uncharacterized protein n=1 Tax=Clostridium mobile TaxID=2841512 RepID=A0ABS6EJ77_9CLOT|nr:hypothetical protein [Clostridium mobile]MBU5485256.1 hypothetical protein [Clostridium mobile]